MPSRIKGHLTFANVMSAAALFVALGGTAVAATAALDGPAPGQNSVGSLDIINGQVQSADIQDNSVVSSKVKEDSLTAVDVAQNTLGFRETATSQSDEIAAGSIDEWDVANGSLMGVDIADHSIGASDIGSQQVGSDEVSNDSLLQSDIRAGAVTGDEVLDDSVTGADINESTLNMPPTTTVTFAGVLRTIIHNGDGFVKVGWKDLPAGSYAVVATINTSASAFGASSAVRDLACELRSGTGFIGGARDRSLFPDNDDVARSLTMNGGAQVPAGGSQISLWCSSTARNESIDSGQLMITRVDGFF